MDKEARIDFDARTRDLLLSEQTAHIELLEAMEREHGLDLDAFTEIYGESALNSIHEVAVKLASNWELLLDGLASSANFVAISRINKKLADGCYGFGKEAEYEYFEDIVLVSGDAKVVSEKDSDGQVRLLLKAPELFRLEGSEFAQVSDVLLASTGDWALVNLLRNGIPRERLMDETTQITCSDSLRELSKKFGYMREPRVYLNLKNDHDTGVAFRALEQVHAQ